MKNIFLVRLIDRFSKQRGTTLAAASSFYFLLTIVPSILVFVRALGYIFGDLSGALEQVFLMTDSFFPKMAEGFLIAIRDLVTTALFGPAELTVINLLFLLVGALSFVNSLWSGVYLLTQDRSFLSWRNYVTSLFVLGFSSLFVFVIFLLPTLFISFVNFVQTNTFVAAILDILPVPREFFLDLAIFDLDKGFLLKSDFLALLLFVFYFSLIFRWMFRSRLDWKDSFFSGFCFSFGLFVMKRLFWLYLETSKQSLMSNYGKAYTLVLGALWIYFIMCLFFLVVSFATELLERRRALVARNNSSYDDDA